MTALPLLAQGLFSGAGLTFVLIVAALLIVFGGLAVFASRYKRCPPNRILVKYGRSGGVGSAKCYHGGATLVWPVIQDYAYLSLEPITIDIDLTSALSKKNIRVAVPSTFTVGVSTQNEIMQNAAQRLLGLRENEIATQARDIILGQMRLVIATLTIEEINTDRERFLDLVDKNVNFELNKVGLYMINVNVRDITDESGYIDALGQKAASEAINQAKVEVAEADRAGAIGQATANRDKEVRVAEQTAQSSIGQKDAEREQRIKVAELEAQGVTGEAGAQRSQEIAIAEQQALSVQGKKQAEAEQRIKVAELEAMSVEGENKSKANIADYEATLSEARAAAQRKGEVALANASRDVLLAEKEEELARMEKEVIAREMIEQKQVQINADAEAERIRRVAKGEADAVLAKYLAEAEGQQKVLEAKALGYAQLIKSCGDRGDLAPSLLIIEKLPELIAEQVKAIQNLKIDKITVWDSGQGHGVGADGIPTGSTGNFLRGLIGSLPPMHELAEQAGIDLPGVLGKVRENSGAAGNGEARPKDPPAAAKPAEPTRGSENPDV